LRVPVNYFCCLLFDVPHLGHLFPLPLFLDEPSDPSVRSCFPNSLMGFSPRFFFPDFFLSPAASKFSSIFFLLSVPFPACSDFSAYTLPDPFPPTLTTTAPPPPDFFCSGFGRFLVFAHVSFTSHRLSTSFALCQASADCVFPYFLFLRVHQIFFSATCPRIFLPTLYRLRAIAFFRPGAPVPV